MERAVFIGKDGSAGLSNGKQYQVELVMDSRYKYRLIVRKSDGSIGVPYDSIRSMLRNWDFASSTLHKEDQSEKRFAEEIEKLTDHDAKVLLKNFMDAICSEVVREGKSQGMKD